MRYTYDITSEIGSCGLYVMVSCPLVSTSGDLDDAEVWSIFGRFRVLFCQYIRASLSTSLRLRLVDAQNVFW